ncbi:MAG TPA: hypothetical protein VMV45_21085 [Casimicrobiaceae bacterium]|nr:hypothetical protein [Casimicrobiaceae bacterium]
MIPVETLHEHRGVDELRHTDTATDALFNGWEPATHLKHGPKHRHYHPVVLKLELLSQGLRVSPQAQSELGRTLKLPHAVGAVGKHALDIILDPGKVYVGLPVGPTVSSHVWAETPFTLEVDDGSYYIGKKPARLGDDGRWTCIDDNAPAERVMNVTIPPYPAFYDLKTSRGLPMRSVMPLAGDFGGATIFPHCHYFGRFVDLGALDLVLTRNDLEQLGAICPPNAFTGARLAPSDMARIAD